MVSIVKKTLMARKSAVKKADIKVALQNLLNMCEMAVTVLAVTTDGHLVCQFSRDKHPLKRLAAMSSTLMSLGDTITDELSMGRCENIISENEEGIVLFTHLADDIVLVAITLDRASLGMLLSACRTCVNELNLS